MNIINRVLPSFRSSYDPASISNEPGVGLLPIPIKNLKLIWPLRSKVNSFRKEAIRPKRYDGKKLSVIVPYRDREEHLREFSPEICNQLKMQGIDFHLMIIEQEFGKPFNRGMLQNIGVKESGSDREYYCLHDVDMLPGEVDYRNCSLPLRPFNYIIGASRFNDVEGSDGRVSPHYFGGVSLIDREQFFRVNGFSNDYWHWGAEDDDLFFRLLLAGLVPVYDPGGKFSSLYHEPSILKNEWGEFQRSDAERMRLRKLEKANVSRYKKCKRGLVDNSSGLSTLRFTVIAREEYDNITRVKVSI